MPIFGNFSLTLMEAGNVRVGINPPVPIGGMTLQFQVLKRFGGGSGLIIKNVSSGLNALSGITITDSGIGTMNIGIKASDTSGWDYGLYTYSVNRLDSGFQTCLAEGFFSVTP